MGLYPLLARAAAIAENENSSFAEALSLAAAERGTPLRRVFADEAEALSHDLGHGGAAEQRAVIDLDNGRIRLEYHRLLDTDSDTVTRSCESIIYSGSSNRFIFTTTGETGTASSHSRGLRG